MHLLSAITPHGFGHAAQVAPVINALRERLPELRVTLLTSLPAAFLRTRIRGDFTHIDAAPDFGLVMTSALAVDLEASAAAYRQLHRDWDARVADQVRCLQRLAPDLLLADVPYLTLAAAAQAGIPALALCSLNWADIYRHYFSARSEAAGVLAQMESAYCSARAFLCPEPAMPMAFLHNRESIDPIAATGCKQPAALRGRLPPAARDDRVVLVAPGGVEGRFPVETWPTAQGVHWLVSANWQVQHPDVSSYQNTGLAFPDLIASCDAVLGKCGYGTVTECVANGTPLMYIPRPDWPEEATLLGWLQAHRAAIEVEASRIHSGNFSDLLNAVDSARIVACRCGGARQAADYIADHLPA